MTPKKKTDEKPEEKSLPVHMTGVDQAVQEKAADTIAHREWKGKIILGFFLMVQTIALGYFHTRNTNAVVQGTTAVQVQTQQVAKKLETSNIEQSQKLDHVAKKLESTSVQQDEKLDVAVATSRETLATSQQNHALSNSLMLAMKKSLLETALLNVEMSSDPNSPHFKNHEAYVAKAKLYEDAYLAHKKTHDEMQAREKQEK